MSQKVVVLFAFRLLGLGLSINCDTSDREEQSEIDVSSGFYVLFGSGKRHGPLILLKIRHFLLRLVITEA